MGNKVMKIARNNTPVKTGRSKRSWKLDRAISKGKDVQARIYNPSPVIHLIEDGHLKKDKNGNILGFQQGEHMLKNAIREVYENLEDDFEKEFL